MIGVRLSRVLFGILLLVVGACQATEPPSRETIASQDQWRPRKPVPRVEMSPQDVAAARQDYLTMYAQSLQLTSVPSVPAEQIGYPEVVVPLQQQCLTAAGVAAQVAPDRPGRGPTLACDRDGPVHLHGPVLPRPPLESSTDPAPAGTRLGLHASIPDPLPEIPPGAGS